MGIYVALLRGINVSGHHIVKMADLKSSMDKLGFIKLRTYLQSGNIVFETELETTSELERIITETILMDFGYDIKVKVIGKKQFQQVFLDNPFTKNHEIDTKQLYYIHLMGQPDKIGLNHLLNDIQIPEKMNFIGEVIYVHYPNGYGRSKLHSNIIERKLKVSATARNYNTMKHLFQMLD